MIIDLDDIAARRVRLNAYAQATRAVDVCWFLTRRGRDAMRCASQRGSLA